MWVLQKIDRPWIIRNKSQCSEYTAMEVVVFSNLETGEVKQFLKVVVDKKGIDTILELLNKSDLSDSNLRRVKIKASQKDALLIALGVIIED